MLNRPLCIIGCPSYYGGADTELLDQIEVWLELGVTVNILHTGPTLSKKHKMFNLEERGVKYLKPRYWPGCKDMHCISFCNGQFLENLRFIKKFAKSTTFVNCMSYNFPKEIQAQSDGFIDFHLYQTEHAYNNISSKLKHFGEYRPLMVVPYFNRERFPYLGNTEFRQTDAFRFGRISRDDGYKWTRDQFYIYEQIESPVRKSGLVLGWGNNAKKKMHGQQCPDFVQLKEPAEISQEDFYKFTDVLIQKTETFENLPRVGFEAMSSGTVLVVDKRGGWEIEVDDGLTGFLCNSTDEFIEKSSCLANDKKLKNTLRENALQKLIDGWGMEKSKESWSKIFDEWNKI